MRRLMKIGLIMIFLSRDILCFVRPRVNIPILVGYQSHFMSVADDIFNKRYENLLDSLQDLKTRQLQTDEQIRKTNEESNERFRKTDEQFRKTDEKLRKTYEESNELLRKSNEESNERFRKTDEQFRKTDELFRKTDEQQRKTDVKLVQLIGYNQNQDSNFEYTLGRSLQKYLLDSIGIPEDCITEVTQNKIYNPITGAEAAEWDAIFLIDYSDIGATQVAKSWPAHNTLILLEAKQNLHTSDVFKNLYPRIKSTIDCINVKSDDVSKKKQIVSRLACQRVTFYPDPDVLVAIGARNIDSKIAEEISSKGCLAIGPIGDDFEVLGGHPAYKVFNSRCEEIKGVMEPQ